MIELTFDVAVCGGGISGCFAAISSARQNKKTVLIEASYCVGGVVTLGPLEAMMTFHDESGFVYKGLAQELIGFIEKDNGSPGYVEDSVGYCKSIVPYDSEKLKLHLFKMLYDNGVEVLLNSIISNVSTKKSKITDLTVVGISQSVRVLAKQFIDATGDGNVARLSGASVNFGREKDGLVQPMTSLIRCGNVDKNLLRQYVNENIHDFKGESFENDFLHLWGFKQILLSGYKEKKLSITRDEIQVMYSVLLNEVIINFTRAPGNPLSILDVSQAQYTTLVQAHEIVNYLNSVLPAFKNAYIISVGKLGVREGGRIKGKYELTLDDIMQGKKSPHVAARGTFPIDIHQPTGNSLDCKKITKAYDISYECLESADIDNLFMCGRCISATHEAIASARITATSMATGQAAGILAALKCHEDGFDYTTFRKILMDAEVLV